MASAAGSTPITMTDRHYRSFYLVGFWVEATIYGMYFFLYIATLSIVRRKSAQDRTGSTLSLVGNTLMFGIATFHNALNIYRMLEAYSMQADDAPFQAPVRFLRDLNNWDAYIFPILLAILTWIGDLLVMYRCWVVYQRNYWVVIVPFILLLTSIGTTTVNLYWFRHKDIPWEIMKHLFRSTFPLNFVQNTLTTGLIAYRIWRQHRKSREAGIHMTAGLDLFTVMRIIIESAFVYTFQQFLMIILFFTGHPSIVIVQHASLPSTGIVFVLIAIRTHVATTSRRTTRFSESVFPVWLHSSRAESDDSATRHPDVEKDLEDPKRKSMEPPRAASIRIELPRSLVPDRSRFDDHV